jgi:hypothetical protein
MVAGAYTLAMHGTWSNRVTASEHDLIEAGKAVLPVVAGGSSDSDSTVRLECTRAVRSVAQYLPRAGWIDVQNGIIEPREVRQPVTAQSLYGAFLPLARELGIHATKLHPLLEDADIKVILAANEALEAIADARHEWLQIIALGVDGVGKDPLRAVLTSALPRLEKELRHADVRVRLAALYILEGMDKEAAPIAAGIAGALSDDDVFVRWAAARVCGRMAPQGAESVVPALAKATKDANGDVLMSVFDSLRRYGPKAKAAAGALSEAATRGRLS